MKLYSWAVCSWRAVFPRKFALTEVPPSHPAAALALARDLPEGTSFLPGPISNSENPGFLARLRIRVLSPEAKLHLLCFFAWDKEIFFRNSAKNDEIFKKKKKTTFKENA